MRSRLTLILLACVLLGLASPDIAAASDTGQSLPWDKPLKVLGDNLRGPTAYGISLLAIISAGAMLLFGGEINELVRRLIMLVLVISMIVFASNVLTTLFVGAAVI